MKNYLKLFLLSIIPVWIWIFYLTYCNAVNGEINEVVSHAQIQQLIILVDITKSRSTESKEYKNLIAKYDSLYGVIGYARSRWMNVWPLDDDIKIKPIKVDRTSDSTSNTKVYPYKFKKSTQIAWALKSHSIVDTPTYKKYNWYFNQHIINMGFSSWNPSDEEVGYFSHNKTLTPQRHFGVDPEVICNEGIITGASFEMIADGSEGTNEPISLYVVVNDAEYLVATVGESKYYRWFLNRNLNIKVHHGSYVEMKIHCATWQVNPTKISGYGILQLN